MDSEGTLTNNKTGERSAIDRRHLLRSTTTGVGLAAAVVATGGAVARAATTTNIGALRMQEEGIKQLTIAQGLDPESLDPQATTVSASENAAVPIVERFVKYDYQVNDNVPVLAAEWSSIDDLTWEVKLREGVTFTNGEPMDAEAAKFSIERIMTMTHVTGQELAREGLTVEIVDDLTIRLTTEAPYPFLIYELGRVSVVPPKYVTEVGDAEYGLNPIGTGPFVLEEWVRGDHVTLARNEEYWGEPAKLDKVIFRAIPEASSRTAALQTGEVDIITLVSISDLPTLEEEDSLQVVGAISNRSVFVRTDTADPRLADKRVRQAFNHAVDKELIIEALLAGYGEVLDAQPVGSHILGYNENVEAYPYDPDKARALLEEAEFDFDTPLVLFTPSGRYAADKEISEAIAGMLSEVGVTFEVQPLEWGVWIEKFNDGTLTPMTFIGLQTLYPDAFTLLNTHVSGSLGGTFSNAEYDAIIEEAGKTVDPEARLALYHQAIEILHDDPIGIYLHQQEDLYAHSSRVEGFTPRPDEMFELGPISVND